MRRRAFLGGLAVAVGGPAIARAQPARATPRIGYLSAASPDRDKTWLAAFESGLRALGYVEGTNISIERRHGAGQFERLAPLAAELVRLKVDVLVVAGAPAAQAAKRATSTIPIVMTNAADPVATGLVASLARPGGNITGLSDFNEGVLSKRLELLKAVAPSAARVAVLANLRNPTNPIQLKAIQSVAPSLGMEVVPFVVQGPEEVEGAFASIRKNRIPSLLVLGDPMFGTLRKMIVEHAIKGRIPNIFTSSEGPEAGALMSYGTSFAELFRRAATYVDKILKGASPADLPIEQPTTFELVVNLKAARRLGVTIPTSVLARADRVIE